VQDLLDSFSEPGNDSRLVSRKTAVGHGASEALFEVESGNREQPGADAPAAMKLAPNRDVQRVVPLMLAPAGAIAAAEKSAAELDQAFR
jgi:hypothetical protein